MIIRPRGRHAEILFDTCNFSGTCNFFCTCIYREKRSPGGGTQKYYLTLRNFPALVKILPWCIFCSWGRHAEILSDTWNFSDTCDFFRFPQGAARRNTTPKRQTGEIHRQLSQRTSPVLASKSPIIRKTCRADKTNLPVEGLSLNRSQCGSCSTKYDTPAGT